MIAESREYGKENNRNLKMVIAIARTYLNSARSTQTLLSGWNLTLPQFSVLESLYHLGDMKICQIMEKTLSTGGNMTVIIRNLEKEGMVKRYASSEDKRSSMISITSKGKDVIGDIFPIHLAKLSQEYSRLKSEEKDQLIYLLKKLNGQSQLKGEKYE